MSISSALVKELREKTGAGIMDCKRALEQTNGSVDKAADILKQQGLAKADKKAGRVAAQGLIEPYIHGAGKIGAIVDVNCETDFVARTADFKTLAHDLAMQVAATKPRYVNVEDVPEDEWAGLEKEFGDRKKATEAVVFMAQPFIKDGRQTIEDVVRNAVAKLGENIVVRRFARFEVGEAAAAEADAE